MANPFKGPELSKKRGGLGRRNPTKDAIKGFVCGGIAVSGKIALGDIKKLESLDDAIALGLTASYDATNKILVYRHIKNFFQYNPSGTLYIMLVAQGITYAQICDKANQYLYKLIKDESVAREVNYAGVVLNPAIGYTPAYTTGLDADALAAAAKVQELCMDLLTQGIYFRGVLIEGRLQSAAAISTLPDLRALTYEYASICVHQDPAIAALDADYARHADVGSALGMLSVRKVSECLGSVDVVNKPEAAKGTETYSLTNAAQETYLSAGLSNGKLFNALSDTEKSSLDTKGYIYAGKYEGLDGFYFNDSHTCIELVDDYAYIEDNAVWSKAATLCRQALLPVMKGEVEIDPATGFLPPSQIASYQARAKKKVGQMTIANEISGDPIIIIEPNQDVVGSGEIKMALAYVRKGILRKLSGTVGAINPAAA